MNLLYPLYPLYNKPTINHYKKPNTSPSTQVVYITDHLKNELRINTILETIPFFSNYFYTITTCHNIIVDGITNVLPKYALVSYMNVPIITLIEYLRINAKKSLPYYIIETYKYLIQSIRLLQTKNLVHFNIKGDTILYNQHKGTILLSDFSAAFTIPQPTAKILATNDATIYHPLEVHVLIYMKDMDKTSISRNDIDQITMTYIGNNPHLQKYQQECIQFLTPFINKDRNTITNEMLKYSNTWDNYSLSILYLQLANNILLPLVEILEENICPNPTKRHNITETIQLFENRVF